MIKDFSPNIDRAEEGEVAAAGGTFASICPRVARIGKKKEREKKTGNTYCNILKDSPAREFR